MKVKRTKKSVKRTPGVDASLKRSGGLSYLEIPAREVHKSAAFYRKVLEWKIRDAEPMKFSDPAGNLIGRFVMGRAAVRGSGFMPYFYIDGIRPAMKRVTSTGAKIIKPISPEGDILVAVVRDPAGNLIGLWQESP